MVIEYESYGLHTPGVGSCAHRRTDRSETCHATRYIHPHGTHVSPAVLCTRTRPRNAPKCETCDGQPAGAHVKTQVVAHGHAVPLATADPFGAINETLGGNLPTREASGSAASAATAAAAAA